MAIADAKEIRTVGLQVKAVHDGNSKGKRWNSLIVIVSIPGFPP
jgi:hypothetical protein